MQYRLTTREGYKLNVAALNFPGEDPGKPQCLFISNGCAIPAHLYPGDGFEAGSESSLPSFGDQEPIAIQHVYQQFCNLRTKLVSGIREARISLAQREWTSQWFKACRYGRFSPDGSRFGGRSLAVVNSLSLQLRQVESLDRLLESAGL